jgi:F-type H+-transporting ATPase subunit alpha
MPDALTKEIGIVRANKHYLVSVEGLPSAHVHDIVQDQDGRRGIVTALSHDAIEVMMLDEGDVRPGQQFFLHPQAHQLAFGEHLFGRVVNAVGDPLDNKGSFPPKNMPLVLEREAGDLARRDHVHEQLITGITMIDTVLPIGKGQRQLLMGPVRSGTGEFCRTVVRNQEGKNTVCIYAIIGKPAGYIKRVAEDLFSGATAKYTILIASTSEDPAP